MGEKEGEDEERKNRRRRMSASGSVAGRKFTRMFPKTSKASFNKNIFSG